MRSYIKISETLCVCVCVCVCVREREREREIVAESEVTGNISPEGQW